MLKYLLLILIVAGVWYGYRYVNRKKEAGEPVTPPAPKSQVGAEDLAACPVCSAYVGAKSAKSCGRGNCPYPAA